MTGLVPPAVAFLEAAAADGPVIDSSVIVAVLAVLGGLLSTVAGVAIARILTTNKEEMIRLQGVEDKFRVLEDYCHKLRDWGDDIRRSMIAGGMPPPDPVPPWPPELRSRPPKDA